MRKLKKLKSKLVNKILFFLISIKIKNILKNKKITELNDIKNIYFKPYRSYDCMALHLGVARALNRNGEKTETYKYEFINIGKHLNISSKKALDDKSNFSELKKNIYKGLSEKNLLDLYYPLIDTIIRKYEIFDNNKNITINNKIFDDIEFFVNKYEKIALKMDALVLADSAYIENQLFKQLFLKKGKKVFYLNPDGQFCQYLNIYDSEFSVKNLTYDGQVDNDEILKYVTKRFAGESSKEHDSRFVFKGSKNNNAMIENRKVLFLHAFKDANNLTWSEDQVFESYYEWIEFTFKEISITNSWSQWYIKKHPTAERYWNEGGILKFYIEKFNIPEKSYVDVPSTNIILSRSMPIYTNSGTICLESLSYGYKSFACGERFTDEIINKTNSKKEWKEAIMLDYIDAKKRSKNERSENGYKLIGSALLYEAFEKKNIYEICPDIPVTPNLNESEIEKVLCSYYRKLRSNEDNIIGNNVNIKSIGNYSVPAVALV